MSAAIRRDSGDSAITFGQAAMPQPITSVTAALSALTSRVNSAIAEPEDKRLAAAGKLFENFHEQILREPPVWKAIIPYIASLPAEIRKDTALSLVIANNQFADIAVGYPVSEALPIMEALKDTIEPADKTSFVEGILRSPLMTETLLAMEEKDRPVYIARLMKDLTGEGVIALRSRTVEAFCTGENPVTLVVMRGDTVKQTHQVNMVFPTQSGLPFGTEAVSLSETSPLYMTIEPSMRKAGACVEEILKGLKSLGSPTFWVGHALQPVETHVAAYVSHTSAASNAPRVVAR